MLGDKHYIKVILDQNATIQELECTLLDVEINTDSYIGKNWIENFIELTDREKVLKVFNNVFENQQKRIVNVYDIRVGESHKLIDFDNEIMVENG